jgi:hypothetical protein
MHGSKLAKVAKMANISGDWEIGIVATGDSQPSPPAAAQKVPGPSGRERGTDA